MKFKLYWLLLPSVAATIPSSGDCAADQTGCATGLQCALAVEDLTVADGSLHSVCIPLEVCGTATDYDAILKVPDAADPTILVDTPTLLAVTTDTVCVDPVLA